jgi:hypothetical protein
MRAVIVVFRIFAAACLFFWADVVVLVAVYFPLLLLVLFIGSEPERPVVVDRLQK